MVLDVICNIQALLESDSLSIGNEMLILLGLTSDNVSRALKEQYKLQDVCLYVNFAIDR